MRMAKRETKKMGRKWEELSSCPILRSKRSRRPSDSENIYTSVSVVEKTKWGSF